MRQSSVHKHAIRLITNALLCITVNAAVNKLTSGGGNDPSGWESEASCSAAPDGPCRSVHAYVSHVGRQVSGIVGLRPHFSHSP